MLSYHILKRFFILATMLSGLFMAGLASAERIKVVTSFTILADMTRQVAGTHADVVSITRPGAEIHGYQPTPQDLVQAVDADLIIYNGFNLEQWMDQFLQQLGDIPTVRISTGIAPIAIDAGVYEGKANPHAWMGLENAYIYIDNIAAALSDIDPQNKTQYMTNASQYKARLSARVLPLKAEIAALPEHARWLVTCEGAFSYLAADLGMRELYLWPINADSQATPQQVRRVIDQIRIHDIPVIFCESTVNTAPAEQVARETGIHYGGVLYVDSLSAEDGPVPHYEDLISVNVNNIKQAIDAALARTQKP